MSVQKRRQLPPQIRKVELKSKTRGRPDVAYEVRVDLGVVDGKRRQSKKRYRTEAEARAALAEASAAAVAGTSVPRDGTTVAQVLTGWIESRTGVRDSTARSYRVTLAPVVQEYGQMPVQQLTRAHITGLIGVLRAGGMKTAAGRKRKPWTARTVNYMLTLLVSALDQAVRDRLIPANPAQWIDKLPAEPPEIVTWSADDVERFLAATVEDRLRHVWLLALSGLRRGEIAGLAWDDIDLDAGTLTIVRTHTEAEGVVTVGAPKSARSRRTLPLPDDLATELRAARKRQAEDRLLIGSAWTDSGQVVVDRAGVPMKPHAINYWWDQAIKAAGVPRIRLHDARHTCATLMHLQGVPLVVIAAWLGHASAAFTLATYAHAQDDALRIAASSAPVVSKRVNEGGGGTSGSTPATS